MYSMHFFNFLYLTKIEHYPLNTYRWENVYKSCLARWTCKGITIIRKQQVYSLFVISAEVNLAFKSDWIDGWIVDVLFICFVSIDYYYCEVWSIVLIKPVK